jgi:hypothetical protein
MKIYEQGADGSVTKTTTMNNSQIVLGSIGMLGGLYYAFTMKKGFWGYVGFGVLGSIAGGLVGNILGGVSQTTTSNTSTPKTTVLTPEQQKAAEYMRTHIFNPTGPKISNYGPGTGIVPPSVGNSSFSMDSVSAIC